MKPQSKSPKGQSTRSPSRVRQRSDFASIEAAWLHAVDEAEGTWQSVQKMAGAALTAPDVDKSRSTCQTEAKHQAQHAAVQTVFAQVHLCNCEPGASSLEGSVHQMK